jgi:hypothetical protein
MGVELNKASAQELTAFENRIYMMDNLGLLKLKPPWDPIIEQIDGKPSIIGYFNGSSGLSEMRDREGNCLWSGEIGLEQSLINPIDFIGPSIIVGLTRSLGLSAGKVAFRSGISVTLGKATARGASSRIVNALSKMKVVAIRLMSRKTVQMISGPYGISVSRTTLEAAMKSAGSTITVVTRLTAKPQVGKALSVAVGDSASALAESARSAGSIYTAKIPKALIVQLERIGLVNIKTTNMGNVVGTEYRFLEAASEFIVPFFN